MRVKPDTGTTHFNGDVLTGTDRNSAGATVNGIRLKGSKTGVAVTVNAEGDDTNIDIALVGKGAGVPRVTANGQDRLIANPVQKTIANASATGLFNVARANNVAAAGVIFYQVFATDGTDYQSMSGMVTYSHVDKAGTGTFTITEVAGNQAKALSTGTYTISWTYVTGTGVGVVKVQPTSSLTATTHWVQYTVVPHTGAVTIL